MKSIACSKAKKIISSFIDLPEKDIQALTEQLLFALSGTVNQLQQHTEDNECLSHAQCCPNCGTAHYKKDGRSKAGIQKYRCLDCGSYFRDSTDTTLQYTRKSIGTWKSFIRCTLEQKSLCSCAQNCGIAYHTAFTWRHKILLALSNAQHAYTLTGIIEMDDTFFHISYKGNHKNSKHFVMPRKAHKRGNVEKVNLAGMAGVLCAVSRGNCYLAQPTGIGMVTVNKLENSFAASVAQDTLVISDSAHAFHRYFIDKHIEHIAVTPFRYGNKNWKKTATVLTSPVHHINSVNAMHARLRTFLKPFCGVSTKYLGNYVSFFTWIENNKQGRKYLVEEETLFEIFKPKTFTAAKQFIFWPAIPQLAA